MPSDAAITVYPIERCDALSWSFDAGKTVVRTSTAVAIDGGCLLVDAVDGPGLDEAIASFGPVVGVCTLLDRHQRDSRKVAERHGCPRVYPSTLAGSGDPLVVAGIQERAILAAPGWNESALWLPERHLLICAEALGTTPYFLAGPDEKLGVHPVLRLRPPVGAFRNLDPVAIAVGHGPPLLEDATPSLGRAIATARSGLPRAAWNIVSMLVRQRTS